MKVRLSYFAMALAGMALLAAACAPAAQKPAAEKPAAEKPAAEKPAVQLPPSEVGAKSGGVLRVAASSFPIGWNPWEESWYTYTDPIGNGLIQFQDWGPMDSLVYKEIVPDLAQSWEWSQDGLSLTLRLRDGVKWHDGQPFTCADAKWSLDTVRTGKDLKRSPRALQFKGIQTIECPDALTMVIRVSAPKPSLVGAIASSYSGVIWPKHLNESEPKKLGTDRPRVGTGPFKWKEVIAGEKATFERNPDYWNKPYPYLDGIEFVNLGTSTAIDAALRAGRADMDMGIQYMSGQRVLNLIRECRDCQVYPRQGNANQIDININHQRPPWNTRAIKDAISYAIDRRKIAQLGYAGMFEVGVGPIWSGSGEFSVKDQPWLKAMPGYDIDNPEANKVQARALLKQAGYQPGQLTIPIIFTIPLVQPIVVPVTEDLEAVGFKVQAQTAEIGGGFSIIGAGDFNVMPWAPGITGADPDAVLYEHYYTGSDRNYGRYSNPEVDRLIDLQSRTLDTKERVRLVHEIARILIDEQAKIHLGWYQAQPVVGSRMRNYRPTDCFFCNGSIRFERAWLAN